MKSSRQLVALAFGVALRSARRARGITQEALAEAGDLDPSYPSMLERGLRTPTLTAVLDLARALEVTPAALIADTLAHLESKQPADQR